MSFRVALLLSWLCVSVASAQPALDKPAFTATPAELLALAKQVANEPHDAVVLREEVAFILDGKGRRTRRLRRVVAILTTEGADTEAALDSDYTPGVHDTPQFQARVVAPDGKVHALDPKTVVVVPDPEAHPESRQVGARLPHVVPGSVIEWVEETLAVRRRVEAGELVTWRLGNDVPTLSTKIALFVPSGVPLKVATFAWPKAAKLQRATANQQQTWRYEIGRLEPNRFEGSVPGDVTQRGFIVGSTAASWQAVARSYRAAIERRIAEGGVALPADLRRPASPEAAQAITTWLHARVKPRDVSLRGSTYAPASMPDVLKQGTADTKDLAVLLVALLRQIGIRAEVALVASGPGRDAAPEAAGIEWFDRAIVRAQIGAREVWIDPGAPLARIGWLQSEVQGRLALVVADASTALVRTPKRTAAETVVRLTRTYELSKQTDGGTRVTEHVHHGGTYDETMRRDWAAMAPARMKPRLDSYAADYLNGTYESHRMTTPSDLAVPFELTVVARDSAEAHTAREAITVELRPAAVFAYARARGDATRVHDFEWPVPHVYEAVNRIVLPPGYRAPALPPDRTRKLGGATLAETRRIDGQAIVITHRLDTGKARWTAAELRAFDTAVSELDDEVERVVIDHEAWSLADDGKSREALAAVDALIKAYPKDGVHHQQRAYVLLNAGLGDAARAAARRAIAVEPKHADMHVFAGWVLRHDAFGREFGPGYDRAGAIAALVQAQKLGPKHAGAFSEHAMVLERDPRGRLYEDGSDLRAAVASWRKAHALAPSHGYGLAMALAANAQYAEAASVAAKLERTPDHDALHVAMIAASASPAAALAKLNSLATGGNRTTLLAEAARKLFWFRLYDTARALSPPPATGTAADVLKTLARKPLLAPGRDPARAAIAANLAPYDRLLVPIVWDRQTYEELLEEDLTTDANSRAHMARVTRGFQHDAIQTATTKIAGRPNGPWRVDLEAHGNKSTLFVAPDRGVARVIGSQRAIAGVGRHALRLVAANDLVGASQLLDWLQADSRNAWISQFWPSGKQSRTAIELAAALVADGPANAIPIYEKCESTLPDIRDRCDGVLGLALSKAKRWPELDAHVKKWLPRATKSKVFAATLEIEAATKLGRHDQADQLAAAQLKARPDEASALRAYSLVASHRGRLADAVARMEPILKKQPPSSFDLNNVAWLLIADGQHGRALELARKATQGSAPLASYLNTLATAEAELGHLADAKTHQWQAWQQESSEPGPASVYVFARIAEQLGLRDDAIMLYKRVARELDVPVSPYDFAQKRLKALGAKP